MATHDEEYVVNYEQSVGAPELTAQDRRNINELRASLTAAYKENEYWGGEVMGPLFADDSLFRYLRARNGDVKKAEKMLVKTLDWRLKERPDLLRAADFSPDEAATGKCRFAGMDRWGRPILVLDNTVENTTDVDVHMRLLFWTTERMIRRMKPPVEKQVMFVHLPDFSLWNAPPLKSSKTSLAVFSLYYAERLGHHIWWQPPSYFSTFIAMIRPFIDPKTMAKVVLINGDTSPGSPNDQKLVAIIGPDWREKTGAEGTRETPKSSPGYIHAKYWKEALDEDAALAEARNCKTPTRSHTEEAPPSPPDHKVSRDTSDIDHYFQAVKGGDEGTVRSLLSSGQIDPISCTNYDGWTGLHMAARTGMSNIVRILLNHGSPCDARTKRGTTPLMDAAASGHVDVVNLLVTNGASVNASDIVGYTALIHSVIHNQDKVINELVKFDANFEQQDKDGFTALQRATQFGHQVCVDALLAAGALNPIES
eukprot:m.291844 g.291844  ORF g.291844 m.291844 type:complete len:481 (+) comp16232_c0_seq5:10351-11793(+)